MAVSSSRLLLTWSLAAGLLPYGPRFDDAAPKPASGTLGMTPALACKSIAGIDEYVELADATLTADDKLQVYYRPLNYKVEARDGRNRVHLSQDSRIRRRGEKAVLQSKDDFLVYEIKQREPVGSIYLTNSVALKGLKPGDYDLEIVLHDRLAGSKPVSQVLKFRVGKPSTPPPA